MKRRLKLLLKEDFLRKRKIERESSTYKRFQNHENFAESRVSSSLGHYIIIISTYFKFYSLTSCGRICAAKIHRSGKAPACQVPAPAKTTLLSLANHLPTYKNSPQFHKIWPNFQNNTNKLINLLQLTLMFIDDETQGFWSTKRAILSSVRWAFPRMLGLQQPELLLVEAILDQEDLGHLVARATLDSKHYKP